jgi:hypothetical protein
MRIRNISAFARFLENHSGTAAKAVRHTSASQPQGAAAGARHADAFTSSTTSEKRRDRVSLRVENGCSIIELHNPEARNALTPHM